MVSGATLADMVVQDIGRDGYSYRVDKKGLYRLPLDDSGSVSRDDLDYGYLTGQYEAALDTKISSIETNNVVPYKHNGKVEKEDIRLVNSIILPAVSSLGYTGVTTGIQVMPDLGNIFIQNSFVDSNPVTGLMGKPSAGISGSGIDSDNDPNSAPVEAP